MHTNLEEQSDQGLFVNLSNSKSLKKINWKILFTTLDHLALIASGHLSSINLYDCSTALR